MNVIFKNLVSLASEGAFSTTNTVVPMSEFKWNILYKIAVLEDVAPYVRNGINSHEDDKNANIPYDVKIMFEKAVFMDQDKIDKYFDMTDLDRQMLTYVVKKYMLKDIVYKERHSIDTSKISLDFLSVILQNTNLILRNGIRMRGIIETGIFLRTKGQLVDFVKVETWLRRLKLKKMASLQASILVDVFGFEKDEFPYIRKFRKNGQSLTVKSLERVAKANRLDRTFSKYSIANYIRYFGYSHSEAFCKTVSTLTRCLSEIEE